MARSPARSCTVAMHERATDARTWRRTVMGMPVTVTIRGGGSPRPAFRVLRAADRRFSTYRPGSEVSMIRRGERSPADAHPDVREVLAACEAWRIATGGAFDAHAGGWLDPSGLVKGWAADRAAAALTAAGVTAFCLDVGGDVVVRGGPWRVGVRHPGGGVAEVLTLTDAAVATSGAYERGDHIADPRTGRPATGLRSATVVAPDLTTADVWATAAFVDPACLPAGLPVLLMDDEGALTTPELDRYRPSSSGYCAA